MGGVHPCRRSWRSRTQFTAVGAHERPPMALSAANIHVPRTCLLIPAGFRFDSQGHSHLRGRADSIAWGGPAPCQQPLGGAVNARAPSWASILVVCGSPGEHLRSTTVNDPQPVWSLGHVQGLEQGLRAHFSAVEIGKVLRDPIKGCMRTVAKPYSEELNGKLHAGYS